MKKIYLALVMLMVGSTAFAQRNIKFTVTLESPATGSTITVGSTFDERIVIANDGPDAIAPGDTLIYADPTGTYFRMGYTKAMGDTIQINKTYSLTGGTSGTIDYCVQAVVFNLSDIDFDTTGFTSCTSINIDAGTGIGELSFKENVATEQLAISPNPTSQVANFDFTAKNNAEVVAKVYDVTGRVVLTYNFGKAFNGQKGYSLNIANLNTGMYFVELNQQGFRAVGKLSKQ